MILPPFLQRWLLLNAVRLLTIVSCTLVISSTIRTLVINFHHYPPPLLPSSPPSSYYPSTDIPTTFLGVFWSTLHHVSTSLVLFIVILSELSLPIPLLHRLFKNTLPFLGPNWGTGFLGVLLILVAGDGLSRGTVGGMFGVVSNWVMASIGLANVAVGLTWKAKAKCLRSPMGWKKDVAEKMEKLAEAKAKAERVVDVLPIGSSEKSQSGREGGWKGLAATAGKAVASKLNERKEKKDAEKEKDLEKAEMKEAAPGMGIFTPPLPSAIIASRPTQHLATQAPQPAGHTYTPSISTSSTTSLPPPAPAFPQPPPPTFHHRPPSSSASVYSLDIPAFSSARSPHPPTPLSPPPSKPPALKTVRFNSPLTKRVSTTIDSHHAQPQEEVGVGGSKFLMLPSLSSSNTASATGGMMDGERSPSVLASLKAAMLEAEAKAKSKPSKKSIYLGSNKWRAEYAGLAEDEKASPQHAEPEKGEKERPYNFL